MGKTTMCLPHLKTMENLKMNEDNVTKIRYEVTLFHTVTKTYRTQIEVPVDDDISDHVQEAWGQVNLNAYDSIEEDEDYEFDAIDYVTEEEEIQEALANECDDRQNEVN